jgi:hypothetical protein
LASDRSKIEREFLVFATLLKDQNDEKESKGEALALIPITLRVDIDNL